MSHRFAIIVAALTLGVGAPPSQAIPPSPGEITFVQPVTSPAVEDVSEPRRLPGDQYDAKRLLPGDQYDQKRLPGDQYDSGRLLPGDQYDVDTLQRH